MKLYRKRLLLGALAAVLASAMVFPSAAATSRKKITSISLKFEANIQPGTDFGEEEIDIEASGDRFTVDDYTVKNEGFGWEVDTVPKLEITMTAAEGYYFTSLPKDKIRLKGAGATYVSGVKQDSSRTLIMTVTLDSLQKSLWEMENVQLTEDGIASWNKMETAGSYELRVYRDGKAVGAAINTTSTCYSCAEKLTKSANYYIKVRPINKVDSSIIGEWKESGTMYVDSTLAQYFKDNPVEDPEGVQRPGAWKQAEDASWWYDNGDGTYPKNTWMQIGEKEYFFDEQGRMKTGWIEWDDKWYFCAESGEKMKNCMTVDNYWLGEDGAMIQQEPDNLAE